MRLFYSYKTYGMWWVRLWNGYGICWRNVNKYSLTFSERLRHDKYIKIGSWIFTLLDNNKKL